MLKNWPGRQSNVELFSELAANARNAISEQHKCAFVQLRITQLGWNYNDILITLPKNTTIYRLCCEIAHILHDNSVPPESLVIYKTSMGKNQDAGRSSQVSDQDPGEICSRMDLTLASEIPNVNAFQFDNEPDSTTIKLGETSVIRISDFAPPSKSFSFFDPYKHPEELVGNYHTIIYDIATTKIAVGGVESHLRQQCSLITRELAGVADFNKLIISKQLLEDKKIADKILKIQKMKKKTHNIIGVASYLRKVSIGEKDKPILETNI